MSKLLKLTLYDATPMIPDDQMREMLKGVLEANGMSPDFEYEASDDGPISTVTCDIDDGQVHIREKGEDDVDRTLDFQLSNEFVVQLELLNIKDWDSMRYSGTYSDEPYRWELEYKGLDGTDVVKSGDAVYPKKWKTLLKMIDAFGSPTRVREDLIHSVSKGIAEESGERAGAAVEVADMLGRLGLEPISKQIGILHAFAPKEKYDYQEIKDRYDLVAAEMLSKFGNVKDYPLNDDGTPADWDDMCIISIANENDMTTKKIFLASGIQELRCLLEDKQAGKLSAEKSLERGAYYASLVKALAPLSDMEEAKALYNEFVDLYRSVFVSYRFDSVRGVIYQIQGGSVVVSLKRGEYDWKTIDIDRIAESATQVGKDLALFLADIWREEADDMLLRGDDITSDIPNLKVLKVAIRNYAENNTGKVKNVVLSVLERMAIEGEQIFTAVRTGKEELRLLESGSVSSVNDVRFSFLGIEGPDKKTYAALFTSIGEKGDILPNDVTGIPVKTVLNLVKGMDHIDGIIIDPFTDSFILPNEEMSGVLDLVKAGEIKRDTAS